MKRSELKQLIREVIQEIARREPSSIEIQRRARIVRDRIDSDATGNVERDVRSRTIYMINNPNSEFRRNFIGWK
jgi:hypothetical protein